MTELRKRMMEDLQLAGYAESTRDSYIDAVRGLAKYYMKSPDLLSEDDIRRFLEETRGNFEAVRANLSEVMITQGFQDLTGQILRSVQRLIGEVQKALGELIRITGVTPEAVAAARAGLEGPAVPGVTQGAMSGQADIDDLMAGLGI